MMSGSLRSLKEQVKGNECTCTQQMIVVCAVLLTRLREERISTQ